MDGIKRLWFKFVIVLVLAFVSVYLGQKTSRSVDNRTTNTVISLEGFDKTTTVSGLVINTAPQSTPYTSTLPSVTIGLICPPGGYIKQDGSIGYDVSKSPQAIGVGGTYSRNQSEKKAVNLKFFLNEHEKNGVEKLILPETMAYSFQSVYDPTVDSVYDYTLVVQISDNKIVTVKGIFPNTCDVPVKLMEERAKQLEVKAGQ